VIAMPKRTRSDLMTSALIYGAFFLIDLVQALLVPRPPEPVTPEESPDDAVVPQ
jgi:hypothetical protein